MGCKVKETIDQLSETISSGRLANAWCRQRAEELLKLMEDVSWGRGGADHYCTMTTLAEELIVKGTDEACRETGYIVSSALSEHEEVFRSHIETHNCVTGD